jgi:hypothetical protein
MGTISIDLNKAHMTRQHGDLLVVFSWCNDERAMILIPAYRKGAAWYLVLESAAWKYDNREYLKRQCMKAAEVLGMEPSPNNWIKLATIIHDGLPDLITMPTGPDKELTSANYGQMELRQGGKTMVAQDIKLEREEGATYG